ncbi:MAG: hypothetical protein A3D28_01195 [Omnitrophica bacterium RIFCSPHIGHO2_02_FULL_63_14]|nr:MAG: hypothetical protein A3D28_01195 [Omnitrophica bacterium RIFCSPHIGHO2_02_FULL_63_14]
MRWDLLEKIEVLDKGRRSGARRSFHGLEDFFDEHYPGHRVVPETLLLEMIAQAAGVLVGYADKFQKEVILAKISEAKFPVQAEPPCMLLVEARLEEAREEGAWVFGTVKIKDQVVAEARMLLVRMDKVAGAPEGPVVFSDKFLKHHGLTGPGPERA